MVTNLHALYVAIHKLSHNATSFAVSGAITWNDLHSQYLLRTITCLTSFKCELRKTLHDAPCWCDAIYVMFLMCVIFVQFDCIGCV